MPLPGQLACTELSCSTSTGSRILQLPLRQAQERRLWAVRQRRLMDRQAAQRSLARINK